jgi:riboflavin synthase
MFSGIIAALGEVTSRAKRRDGARLEIRPPKSFGKFRRGESLAVSGVCLTALSAGPVFRADLSSETLAKSSLGSLRRGARVNLERPVRPSDRLSGHLVAGHVDALARVVSVESSGDGWQYVFSIPGRLARYVVEKGSVALDGISLTAFEVRKNRFRVAVIPHTWRATTLRDRRPGDTMNFEADMMAKFAEKLVRRR